MDLQANDDKTLLDNNISTLRRIVTQYKSRVFGIIFVLLKDNDTPIYVPIFLCVLEFLQAISLMFHQEFSFLWGSHDIYKVVSQVLGYTRLVPYIKGTNITLYSIVFYLILTFILLIIAISCYVSYVYERKKSSFSWTISILKAAIILLNSIFFLPFFEFFLVPFSCAKDSDGESYLSVIPTEKCGAGLQLVNSIVAGLSAVLLFTTTTTTALTFFEGRNVANKPNSRVTARANLLFNLYKFLIVTLLTFLHSSEYRIFNVICIVIGSILLFLLIQFDNPFYNLVMAKVWSTAAAVNLWSAIMLLFAQIMSNTTFREVMLTWLIGLPLVLVIILKTEDKRMETLLINVNLFSNGKEIINQVTYLLKLLESQGRDKHSAMMLDGYLEVHKQDCSDINCPLKRKNRTLSDNKITRNLLSNNPNLSEKDAMIIYIVYKIYIDGLVKFPTDITLHISYAFFLLDIMHSKQQALHELNEAEQKEPAFDEEFIIYRYKKIIEDEIADLQNGQNTGVLDVVNEITFQSHLRTCQANIEKASLLHLEFWSQLSEEQPDLGKLSDLGSKIHIMGRRVEEHWSKLMKIDPNNIKMIRLFGKFLIEVLHDRERGEELLDKITRNANKNNDKKGANFMPTDGSADEGIPLIVISGERDRFAVINNINLAAASLFGFSKGELINRKVNTLMPPLLAKYHDSFISNYLEKNESSIMKNNKERLVFGKSKANYIFPFYYRLKAIPSIIQGIQFVSTLHLDKNLKNTAYVLTNAEGTVDSISSSCISLLKMDVKQIIQKHIKIQDCVANIITERANIFAPNSNNAQGHQSANHTQLTFKFPKGSPYIEEDDQKSTMVSCSMVELNSKITEGHFGFQFNFDKAMQQSKTIGPLTQDAQISNFQFRFSKGRANIIGEFADEKISEQDIAEVPAGEENDSNADQTINKLDYTIQMKKPQEDQEETESKRIDYSIGIKTLRLVNDKIEEIIQEEKSDGNNSENEEKENGSKKKFGLFGSGSQEGEEEEGSLSDFGNTIKSKKVLDSVMNNRALPSNLKKLRLLGGIMTLILIGISIFDYANITMKANNIDSNIANLDISHRLIANMMTTLYGIQNLYLISKNVVVGDEVELRRTTKAALDAAKLLKEYLEKDEKQLSDEHSNLLNNPSVRLKTIEGEEIYKSLTQATEDIITKGLSVINGNLQNINSNSPDYHFLAVNMLNNYYSALIQSSEYYAEELVNRTTSDSSAFSIVLILSLMVLVLSFLILIPLIYSITQSKKDILTLFFHLPTKTVKLLYSQCENFVINLQVGGEDDEMASEIDEEEAERIKEENENSEWQPKARRRKFKNDDRNKQGFFIKFFIMFCFLEIVFVYNFVTSTNLLNSIASIATEFNSTSLAEAFYSFSNNAQRQLFIDSTMLILNKDSKSVVANNIALMQSLDSQILNENSMNIKSHTDEYNDIFKRVMYQDSCSLLVSDVSFDICESFTDKTITKGMTVAIVRHFENMRTLLKAYDNVNNGGVWPFNAVYLSPSLDSDPLKNMILSLFRVPYSEQIAEMQGTYIKSNYRRLLENFKSSLTGEFDSLASLRLLMFIFFIFEALILYLFLWIPLVSILNDKLWKTKLMLKMIPISVLVKIKNIRNYLRKFLNRNHLHQY